MNGFGEYLIALRKKRGFRSQRQLALACGIAATTVCRIEHGGQKPDFHTLTRLAQVLQVEYGDLVCKVEGCPTNVQASPVQEEQLQEFLQRWKGLSEKQKDRFVHSARGR